MNKNFLSIIMLVSAVSLMAMDADKQTSDAALTEKLNSAIDRQCTKLKVEKAAANQYFAYMLSYVKQENAKTDAQFDKIVAGTFKGAALLPGMNANWCGTCKVEQAEFRHANANSK